MDDTNLWGLFMLNKATANLMARHEENVRLVEAGYTLDEVNGAFYRRFPYPQVPSAFSYLEDPDFARIMLNQDIGDYSHAQIPKGPNIWVAGCGTNQAVMTALRFPEATVLASDLSKESLAIAERYTKAFGIAKLNLRLESINDAPYDSEFDYIICTGVIHHNTNPAATLATLAKALRPAGVLELMVYNGYHWGPATCFQRAIQLLDNSNDVLAFESQLRLARQLISELSPKTSLGAYVQQFRRASDEVFADALLQPVMYTYTIESLARMAVDCGLFVTAPCVNAYDRANDTVSWEHQFSSDELQDRYDALPDLDRWQISNLLTRDKAPYLWFYFDKGQKTNQACFTKEICDRFLNTVFVRASTTMRRYGRQPNGSFSLSPAVVPYPGGLNSHGLEQALTSVDGAKSMRQIYESLGIATTLQSVNSSRLRLTTSAFPYLRATETPR